MLFRSNVPVNIAIGHAAKHIGRVIILTNCDRVPVAAIERIAPDGHIPSWKNINAARLTVIDSISFEHDIFGEIRRVGKNGDCIVSRTINRAITNGRPVRAGYQLNTAIRPGKIWNASANATDRSGDMNPLHQQPVGFAESANRIAAKTRDEQIPCDAIITVIEA